jgi:hypothetical protein
MVLLVLSAMASTSKLLYPYANYAVDRNVSERYEEISKYMLLNAGEPSHWGEGNQTITAFGLAKVGSGFPYDLDIDKVSRLNDRNLCAISYAQLFQTLSMSDVSFRMEMAPIFDVNVSLTAISVEGGQTTYRFEVLTGRHGLSVAADLKTYAIAKNYVEAVGLHASGGRAFVNVTLSDTVQGPALLIVLARSAYNAAVVSFKAYAFAHNSTPPKPSGTFLKLSPLNHTLTASFAQSNLTLLSAYAFTFSHNSMLMLTGNSSQSATYSIPHFVDSSPIIVVVTGSNSSAFFAEHTAYPQVPLRIGADFASSEAHSNVFTYTYSVAIDSVAYECVVWLGGPRE